LGRSREGRRPEVEATTETEAEAEAETEVWGGGARSGGTVRETEGERESRVRESSWASTGMGNLGVNL
jgi:hypothetical protein